MKNKIFVISAIVILGVGFVLLTMFTKAREESASDIRAASNRANFIRPHSPSFGNSLARVTVVEWFDPECESCRAIHPVIKKLLAEYKDRVHFVLRYMPYHSNSMFAASALEEAREHGKYEEALDVLFEKQSEWGSHDNPKPELIVSYLVALGVPKEKLERDMVINKHQEKIKMDEADGNTIGIRGTPTFFVNEKIVRELGEEPLRSAIETALQSGQ